MEKRIVFTGGGTAGHVLPARAVIERLAALPAAVETEWIGSRRGIERGMVESWGIGYWWVPSGKLRRYFSLRNFFDLFSIGLGILASLVVLMRRRPDLLFSKGGYVSVPPVIAAWLLRIPVISHDSDLLPGLATRINARFSQRILVAYQSSAERLRRWYPQRVVVSGNPVRQAILRADRRRGLQLLGFSGRKPVVLFLGGSLGSAQINQLVQELLPKLRPRCDIVHQRGSHQPVEPDGADYRSFSFVAEEYADLLAAADVVVCRAGAGTLWEVALTAKPAILLPLGTEASRGDQIDNARYFAERGAAIAVLGKDAVEQRVLQEIEALISDPKRADAIGGAAKAVCGGDPAGTIVELITSLW